MLLEQSIQNIKLLNPLTLPLYGMRLIEASAGTGKTYTITILYLRLILGLGEKETYLPPLSVKNILVVTFTDSATKEIRDRIRDNIHCMKLACIYKTSNDPLLMAILDKINCIQQAIYYLSIAERQIDEAAIFTIHSFALHILKYNTLESSMLAQQTIVEDESFLQKCAVIDFWRKHCYPLPIVIASIIKQYWEGPEQLLKEILPYLNGDLPIILQYSSVIDESIVQRHTHIISNINTLKNQWMIFIQTTGSTINNLLTRQKYKIYNSTKIILWIDIINQWAQQVTNDYYIPKELKQFKKLILISKIEDINIKLHTFFCLVEEFYQQQFSLRELIFTMALKEIRSALELEKQRQQKIGFNDLLNYLDCALKRSNGVELANTIRSHYPVAIIDEFQDTDPQQYRIFTHIYKKQIKCGLILIGDPKQAIYSFRGADIFTYILARTEIDNHYTLNTNWRSSTFIVKAINQIFYLQSSFIFKEIPFFPSNTVKSNNKLQLIVRKEIQPALCIWLQPGISVNTNEYKEFMTNRCVMAIKDLLNAADDGDAWLETKNQKKHLIQASDIVVIVRNHKEAVLIHDALAIVDISSIYLSNQDNVFKTLEAQELLWILQAILNPEQDNKLRCALATNLLGLDANTIDILNTDEYQWEHCIDEFIGYRQLWSDIGILSMLYQLIINFNIKNNLLLNGYKNKLTNLLHLGELLQEKYIQINNQHTLIRWLTSQIELPQSKIDNQKIRLENNQNCVQIITIHKAKGLEFPLVFLPFISNFRLQKKYLFHNRQTYRMFLDLTKKKANLELAEEERLAEDIRLLYVAITRSIYHCSIGLAPISNHFKKNTDITDLHLSAIGYLIQKGQKINSKLLEKILQELELCSKGNIKISKIITIPKMVSRNISIPIKNINISNTVSLKKNTWKITSYSELQQYNHNQILKLNDENIIQNETQQVNIQLTPHTFIRGPLSGIFLHRLLELINFTCPIDETMIYNHMQQYDINRIWLPIIVIWLKQIINVQLGELGISLRKISTHHRKSELKFYLSINTIINPYKLDIICKTYDPLSARCAPLELPQIQGILKGYIDLVFRWCNRYYLLDYKSNWLGEDDSAYTQQAIEHEMITHRYELQYQIYTLALHRFLRQRLKTYDYQRDFGGVFYMFLRGINNTNHKCGIFYSYPQIDLINNLDKLFTDI